MSLEKAKKTCSNCETKYTIEWDTEVQDLEPLTCPFCGWEVEEIDDTDFEKAEDDSWN
jgi:transcription initiation factor IIE alpha subunit|tara:strand:+ start:450 stop:623 length:174 start_codon:yes stop_codon:yes gene_type:complete